MTEGPLKKGNGSSYLISYRHAFTGIAQKMGFNIGTTATPFFQDLSFKINSGSTKLGKFSLFGIMSDGVTQQAYYQALGEGDRQKEVGLPDPVHQSDRRHQHHLGQ